MINLYLASDYDVKRGFGAYCALYEDDTKQHALRAWRTQQKATSDSLALECATDALEQLTHIVELKVFTINHGLLKGCVEHIGTRRLKMAMHQPVNHAQLWAYLDRHIDEWAGHNVPLTWVYGSHTLVENELKRLMMRG